MTKESIINSLIKDNGFEKYMEIGYQNGHCYDQIECKYKAAVDPAITEQRDDLYPMTSDDFFAGPVEGSHGGNGFDVVFIDGDHTCEQVRKDIINASKVLSENGVILIHDIAPEEEGQAIVPRQQKVWCGTAYQAWEGFKSKYPDIKTAEFDVQFGLGAIYPKGKRFRAHFEITELSWDEYKARRNGK